MKTSIAAVALLSAGLCAAADLTIPAGQIYTVSPAQSDLRLERLTIGDNAQIRFAEGVSRWRVDARHVNVGSNVVIDGRGAPGTAGVNGGDMSGKSAKDCEAGATGGAGGAGGPGANGVSLVLWWGIDAVGSVKVLADGGAGAAGGNGGKGQDAGRINLCNGARGGDGGQAGAGGSGGRGGDVSLSYFDARGGQVSLRDKLSVSNAGGHAAAGGTGGAGGGVSEGRFQRTPNGDRWFRPGEPGAPGATGAQGVAGSAGSTDIQVVAASDGPAWAGEAGSNAPADRGTVVSLQQQVQALQAQNSAPAPVGFEQQLQALQDQIKKLEARVKALESH